MIIAAEIYGRIVSANIVILPRAPPENILNIPKTPLLALFTISDKATALIPGTGIYVPNLYTIKAPSVNNILWRSSVAWPNTPNILSLAIN